jgi:hypothetical protein
MASDQVAQAKADLDAALRLIELGHLEPAQELLRFASAELDDALSILQVGEPDRRPQVSVPARAYAEAIRQMAQTARTKEVVPSLMKLADRLDILAEQRDAA